MIIGNGSNGKVEADKLEVKMDKLSKIEIDTEVDKAMIFSTDNLITNPALKPYVIVYNFKNKTLPVTCLHFIDNK